MTVSAWGSLLDVFEQDLQRDPDRSAGSGWEGPAEPLPAELADRARDLLARQRHRIAQLRAELDVVSEHLDALRRIPEPSSDAPAFLDVAG
jgi:hypothetical protein